MFLKIGEPVTSESGNIFSVPLFMEREEKQPLVLGTITLMVPQNLAVPEYMDLKERMANLAYVALLGEDEVRQFATMMEMGESILEEKETPREKLKTLEKEQDE